jgi:hypothetical protein
MNAMSQIKDIIGMLSEESQILLQMLLDNSLRGKQYTWIHITLKTYGRINKMASH